MDVINAYIGRRKEELASMIAIYDLAKKEPPIDLLARYSEVERLESRLAEYYEVQDAEN